MNSQYTKPILDFLKWKIILTNFIMLMISFSLKAQAIDESFGNRRFMNCLSVSARICLWSSCILSGERRSVLN